MWIFGPKTAFIAILCWIVLGEVCTVQVGALKENSSNVSFYDGIFLINGTQDITDIFALFFYLHDGYQKGSALLKIH